jgi:hypothetical protein
MMADRFPTPWRVVEMAGCFTVQNATGQNVAWFYFLEGPTVAPSAAVLLKEQAKRRAMNFAGSLLDKTDQLRRLVDLLEPTMAEPPSREQIPREAVRYTDGPKIAPTIRSSR